MSKPIFIPEIVSPEDYNGESEIIITAKTEKQKRLWCESLPKIHQIKSLSTNFRIKEDLFEAICQMKNLEILYLETMLPTIEGIERLTGLRELYLYYSPKLTDIAPVGKMVWLQKLGIHLPKITDYSALASLVNLTDLELDGPMDGKQKLDNIHFVKNMHQLRYLSLTSTQMKDKNFDAILHLKKLETLDISWNYPKEEFEKLRSLPNLKNCPPLCL